MVLHHWALWQVVGSHGVNTMQLIRRPAEREKSSASSGLSSGAKTSCAMTRMFSETQESDEEVLSLCRWEQAREVLLF